MNAVLASAERLLPGMRGRAAVDGETLARGGVGRRAAAAAGLLGQPRPRLRRVRTEGVEVAAARVGRLPLPPALAEQALRLGLDRALGPGAGEAAVSSVAALLAGAGRGAGRLPHRRRRAGAAARADAVAGARRRRDRRPRAGRRRSSRAIQAAVRTGELPRDGSVLPYLRFVVEAAERQDGPARERARGALYALALYCGDPGFETAVGVSLPGRMQGRRNGCAGTTLGGRDDLRRHFAISAGLDAATSGDGGLRHGRAQGAARQQPRRLGLQLRRHGGGRRGRPLRPHLPRGAARGLAGAVRRGSPTRTRCCRRSPACRAGFGRRVRAPATAASTATPTRSSSPRSTGGSRRCRCTARGASSLAVRPSSRQPASPPGRRSRPPARR